MHYRNYLFVMNVCRAESPDEVLDQFVLEKPRLHIFLFELVLKFGNNVLAYILDIIQGHRCIE